MRSFTPLLSILFLFHLCVLVTSAAQPSVAGTDRTADAKAFVSELAGDEFQKAFARFDATMHNALPEAKLRETWDGLVSQVGDFRSQGATRTEDAGVYTIVFVTCHFARATLDTKVVFNTDGEISGVFFVPSAQPEPKVDAPYIAPDRFTEVNFTLGTAPWQLPGTLALPNGAGPFPAIVLVHGSGPQDRDETVGANAPFRDLALGLASRGIAVLRYDKRTKHYAAKLNPLPLPFTVNEETVDDAVAAVAALQRAEHIDKRRIYVLGHSLGGMLIPRIAARAGNAAGFIILAGTTRPLEDVIIEQTNYLALADGAKSVDEQKQIDAVQAEVSRIKKLSQADAANPALIFGAPASYWLDLRGYDPVAAAQSITKPVLILQGERDYQVTLTDFSRWKSAFAERANVTMKTYPRLNHLFEPGDAPSVPADYAAPLHVAPEVIDDVAAWITR